MPNTLQKTPATLTVVDPTHTLRDPQDFAGLVAGIGAISVADTASIAHAVRHLHAIHRGTGAIAIAAALKAGELLEAAKKLCAHGEFGKWEEREFPHISSATRARYRDVYKAVRGELGGALPDNASDLMVAAPAIAAKVKAESLNELYESAGITKRLAPPANVNPDTGKRIKFEAKAKTPEEKEAEAAEARKGNFFAAVDTLVQVIDEGAAGDLTDDDLNHAIGLIRDQAAKLEQLMVARKTVPKSTRRKPSGDIADLA